MEIQIDPHTLARAEERGADEEEILDVVLDIGEGDRIIGIEILDASRHVTLDRLLPVKYEVSKAAV